MAMKCVHKGCGKKFDDENEDCIYHPGPPVFHEGQKGWNCCKPRVLTFDEFLDIPPCTTGKHSTVDHTPAPPAKEASATTPAPASVPTPVPPKPYVPPPSAPLPTPAAQPTQTPALPPESDSDEPDATVPPNVTCRRRGCGASSSSNPSSISRDNEKCVYHSGSPIFHEGSKGWTCCKRKVLEFDEFLKIEGCKTRSRHCFVGKKKVKRKTEGANGVNEVGADDEWENVTSVRQDFYQTPTQVQASLYFKKVDKGKSKIHFKDDGIGLDLDLKTSDGKRYVASWRLCSKIEPSKSSFAIKGTKVDLTLEKAESLTWPVLRADDMSAAGSAPSG